MATVVQGPRGIPGLQGLPGKDGKRGPDGKAGLNGRPGTNGSPGTDGRPGTNGSPGTNGTGTTGSSLNFAVKLDGPNVTRYTSGGTQMTSANANMDSGRPTVAQAYAGALVAAAASSSARLLGHGPLKNFIPAISDTYFINFGGHENMLTAAIAAAGIGNASYGHAPVIIGPQQTFLLHLWLPAQAAASSFEVEVGYFER